MKRIRVAVDMDEVIADALKGMRAWVKAQFQVEWDDAQLVGYGMPDLLPADQFAALQEHLHEGEFFGGLDVIEGAAKALRDLTTDYDVFITTAAMEFPRSLQFKWDWLRSNFAFLDPLHIVFCGDKSIINADYLIDDNARHFERFVGQGIVFDAPHNANVTGYPRVNGWANARPLIERLTA